MSKFKMIFVAIGLLFLIACGGGGDGSCDSSGACYSHKELAENFVWRLNNELGWDVDLKKTVTHQFDYIVVFNDDTNSYDAYYLGRYHADDDIEQYLNEYEDDFYFDLDRNEPEFNDYEHYTGKIFENGGETPKDMMAVAAQRQGNYLEDVSQYLVQSFRMPQETAKRFAVAALKLHVAGKQGMKEEYYSRVMQSLTGTNLQDWQDALIAKVTTGSSKEINDLVEISAEKLNMSSADLNQAIEQQFGF